jgi:hypothetical protein
MLVCDKRKRRHMELKVAPSAVAEADGIELNQVRHGPVERSSIGNT